MPNPAPLDSTIAAVGSTGSLGLLGPATLAGFFMPEANSEFSAWTDLTMAVINIITAIFFVAIIAVMVFFAWKYRRHGDREHAPHTSHHNTALELSWTLPPLFIVLGLFYMGFVGFWDQVAMPADAYHIQVRAKMWNWEFVHPNGAVADNVLEVPSDRPVVLTMSSSDVLHSFFVPEFRVKKDVVPGRYTQVWFKALTPTPDSDLPLPEGAELEKMARGVLRGRVKEELSTDAANPPSDAAIDAEVETRWAKQTPELIRGMAQTVRNAEAAAKGLTLYCTEYCGTNHSNMLGKVVIHEPGWTGPVSIAEEPVVRGRKIFTAKCTSCHYSVPTGGEALGPNFANGIFGQPRQTNRGTVTADENYLRESIVNPQARIVPGFGVQMSLFQLSDSDIDALVAYLKSLGGAEGAGDGATPQEKPDDTTEQPEKAADTGDAA